MRMARAIFRPLIFLPVKVTGIILALSIVPISSCSLEPSGPAAPLPRERAILNFALSQDTYAALTDLGLGEPQSLQISVYKMQGDQRAGLDGPVNQFAALPDGLYTIRNIGVGLREFVIEVFDQDLQLIAQGQKRHLVQMGEQELGKVEIKSIEPLPLSLEIPVTLLTDSKSKAPPSSPSIPESEPEEAARILGLYSCKGCHAVTASQGQLILARFPYETTDGRWDYPTITTKILAAVKGDSIVMPPFGNPMKEEDIKALESAFTQSTPSDTSDSAPPGSDLITSATLAIRDSQDFGTTHPLEFTENSKLTWASEDERPLLYPHRTYSFILTLKGPDGVDLWTFEEEKSIDRQGLLTWPLTLDYRPPEIRIRIELK